MYSGGAKANVESANQFAEGNIMRTMSLARAPVRRARIQLLLGDPQGAFDKASAAAAYLEGFSIAAGDGVGVERRGQNLQAALGIVSESALQLGRYGDAEAAARTRLPLPLTFLGDPSADKANRQVQLALALAYQGRGSEARDALAPALEYYGREKKAGAAGTSFRLDYAYALLASALAQDSDAAGRAARQRALAAAESELAGASDEVRKLYRARDISARIASARSTPGS